MGSVVISSSANQKRKEKQIQSYIYSQIEVRDAGSSRRMRLRDCGVNRVSYGFRFIGTEVYGLMCQSMGVCDELCDSEKIRVDNGEN